MESTCTKLAIIINHTRPGHPRALEDPETMLETGGQNRTYRQPGRIEKPAAKPFAFSALLVNYE